MAWVELREVDAELTLSAMGDLSWNVALQVLLGDPTWVGLHWDEPVRRLGIRRHSSNVGLPVQVDQSIFSINSASMVTGLYMGPPVTAAPPGMETVILNHVQCVIYYVVLP